eukprot:Pgem_evm1s14440
MEFRGTLVEEHQQKEKHFDEKVQELVGECKNYQSKLIELNNEKIELEKKVKKMEEDTRSQE